MSNTTIAYNKIPGPNFFSFIKNVRANPVLYCYELMKKYGDVVRCRSFQDIYLISHPVLAKEVFINSQKLFDKNNFINNRLRKVIGEGLVVSNGAQWKRQRKAAQVIYKKEHLQSLTPVILQHINRMIEELKFKAAKQPVNISFHIRELIMKIMADYMFPLDDEMTLQQLKENLFTGNEYVSNSTPFNFPEWIPMSRKAKLGKALNNIDNIVLKMMDERNTNDKYEGKLLADIMDQKDEDGNNLSRQEMLDEIKNIFIASFFTTSDLLSWLAYSLAQYSEWSEKIFNGCKFFEENADTDLLESITDMQLFIHEVLRFYSPAWASSHRTLFPLELGNYCIPKNTTVMVSIYNLHRHPNFWNEPEKFMPERFNSFHKFPEKTMFVPYGLGPRKCVGMGLATLIINIVCAKLACNFRFSVNDKIVPAVQSRVSLGSKEDLQIFLSLR